jgi:hypothetical protein
MSILPTDPKERKEVPLASGLFDYFTDALIAIARLSNKANVRHNPGEKLHWSKGKSTDHADCALRHFAQRGEMDPEWNESHTVEFAWRALALLQMEIEARNAGMSYADYIKKLEEGETGAIPPSHLYESPTPVGEPGEWIGWAGKGALPTGLVDVTLRNGDILVSREAKIFRWAQRNTYDDIVRYRRAG